MIYDFDTIVERRNTNSLKYDFAKQRQKAEDILPLWVADMDFKTASGIMDSLEDCIAHGIYGYSEGKEEYFQALYGWYAEFFKWETKACWLVKTPGVVFAIAAAIRSLTNKGDSILIQSPVYYPFREVIESNKRNVVASSLILKDGHYEIDFEDFERKIKEKEVKLFLLCSPHNPVGRVWTKEELIKMGEVCLKYQVKIVSDEIHCDFTYPGYQHYVFASLNEAFLENTITCTSPSKTFNLAGLQVSNIFIADEKVREQFQYAIEQTGYSQISLPGLVACQAAYETGRIWLTQLKQYLKSNLDYVRKFLKEELPRIKLIEPEGTYLIWIDFRELKLTESELERLITQDAKLWLDAGTMFGIEGTGFQRINIACSKKMLEKAMQNLKKALY
jgi:Bifunctional PLP-dependent enzyme with beta-cystathionase and maltose regulon repressor activities